MANPGKNKLMKYARVYTGGYNISGDAQAVGSLGLGFGEVDMTGWSNSSMQFLTDKYLNAGIEGFQAHMNDTASSGSLANLQNPSAGQEVSFLFGGNAEPDYGDPAYFLAGSQMSANVTFNAGATILNATWRADTVDYNEWPIGIVLSPETARSATFQGTSHNNGGASANGWHAILHVIASSGGTWSFVVRHSTDDAAFSDLGTFTADGSAITSEHLGGTGTVNQYVRLEGNRTAGTVTVVCVFARNIA